MFSALTYNEDFLAERISAFIALGPVLKLTHCKSTLVYLAAYAQDDLLYLANLLGIYEFFPANWLTTGTFRIMCGFFPEICETGIYLIVDEDIS